MPPKLSDECRQRLREIEESLLVVHSIVNAAPSSSGLEIDDGIVMLAQVAANKIEQSKTVSDEDCKEILRGVELDIGNQLYLYRSYSHNASPSMRYTVASKVELCLNRVRSLLIDQDPI